jgi:hypothetical protein
VSTEEREAEADTAPAHRHVQPPADATPGDFAEVFAIGAQAF